MDKDSKKVVREIEITVKKVSWPKQGKKKGWIISTEGEKEGTNFYGCYPGMLSQFREGAVCRIEYTSEPKDGGGEWRDVVKKLSETPTVLQRPPIQVPRARTSPADSEQIFVVALLKESYSKDTGAVELLEEINKLRRVWRNSFGGSETQRDDEMHDEIPY